MSSIHGEMRVWRLHLRSENTPQDTLLAEMPYIGEFIGE
jgi:hypothetical protein